ncbi:MAG: hypothetical protein ACRCS0_13840 [Albidovulum sp.]
MFRLVTSALALVLLASPVFAFNARNGMDVRAIDSQTFVVEFPSPYNEKQYLCAAGDYVIRALGMSARTRIFRASPPPRKQGQGITFTLDETKKVDLGLLSSFSKNKGDGGISAGVARDNFCTRIPIFF